MSTPVQYLADASAIIRLTEPEVATALSPLIQAGEVATCAATELALLSLLRDPATHREVRAIRATAFPWLETRDEDLRRALDVQALLVESGHPGVSWPSLVVAAVAERHRTTVLHYDSTFSLISGITGQEPLSAIAPLKDSVAGQT
jgi:predicted nucleic acid-binding protein